jgi:Flp pilus assembly pilin Flp
MRDRERRRSRRQRGQGTVEYEVLLAAGALLVILAMLLIAGGVDRVLTRAATTQPVFKPPVAHCDASYEGVCIPPGPPDLDCADLTALGIPLPVTVVGGDPHGLDPDGDGLGC